MKKIIKFFCLLIIILSFTFLNMINIKAASATISVSSSTSRVVIGNTFNVTIKISSSSSLGAWEWTIDYDKKKLQLISGEANVADVFEKENTKSKSYTYKFKAIGTGSSKISVKSYGALDTSENSLSLSISSKTISVITQAELEATYSKNNNLKSLSIDGLKLEPSFSKNTTDYKVEANANTEEIKINASLDDSKSSLTGTGTHKVSEGDNKFKIVVTAENGSTKTYTITISVKDPNPINIKINDEELTVVKRESSLEAPEEFEKTTIEINEQKVPGFYNETNDITLVGLKDANGEIGLYIYNKDSNNYSKYTEVSMNDIKLLPLEIEDSFSANTNLIDNNKNDYFKTKININSDADEVFYGIVTQVRNEAITTSNVVTYEVIIEIDNKDLKLKPGMTANVEIITAEKLGVYLVPNKALRFYIEDEYGLTKRYKDKGLWVLQDGVPMRISINVGVSDDDRTEVSSDMLNENLNVILAKKEQLVANKGNTRMRIR